MTTLAAARAVVVTALEGDTATIDSQGFVKSVTVGTASTTDCEAYLEFEVDRYETPGGDAIKDRRNRACVSWKVGSDTFVATEKTVQQFGRKFLDPNEVDRVGMIPCTLYDRALDRLGELYLELFP